MIFTFYINMAERDEPEDMALYVGYYVDYKETKSTCFWMVPR